MMDNARIVRDYIYPRGICEGSYDSKCACGFHKALAALTALETELATAQADLERARGEERERIIGIITDRRNEIPWLTPVDQRESIHADPRKIRAALDPEQKGE